MIQLQQREDTFNSTLSLWQGFNTQLLSLQSASAALTQASTFLAATGSSTNTAVASVSVLPGAEVGDHSLTVTQLAQSQKVVSKSFTSGNTALGESGSFTLNGKTIAVDPSSTLTDLSARINAAGAGATAAVVNVGPNDFRMTLTSTATGTANALSVADSGSGAALVDLGLVKDPASFPPAVRQTFSLPSGQVGAGALPLSSATQAVGSALGLSSPPAGAVSINGTSVAIDLNTDSLNAIASKINAAGISGVTAQVVALPDANGNVGVGSKQQLQILGASSAPTFADSNNVLASLGVVQGQFAQSVTNAQDAQFTVDGLSLTRSSNLVNDAVPGASIKLLQAGQSTLSVGQDTNSIGTAVTNFANAYNAVQDFINTQNQFTPPAAGSSVGTAVSTSPLFGNSALSSVQSTLSATLQAVSGSTSLQSLGITVDGTNNHLVVDNATLATALQTNPSQVASLFGLSGQADNAAVKFVTATGKTQATNGAGYAVNITQAAAQAHGTASVGHTDLSALSGSAETLTFGGALFSGGASITLTAGSTLQDMANQINHSSALNGQIYASIDPSTHALAISSLSYGYGNGFTVSSDQAGSATNSGLGTNTVVTDGADVEGTINGETATGRGQTLTGNAGNATTEGLALLVTSSATGALGKVTVTHGVADSLGTVLGQILDTTNGTVIGAENALNAQISDAQTQIQSMQDHLTSYTDFLRQTFTTMETRVSQLQSQSSAFSAQLSGLSSTG